MENLLAGVQRGRLAWSASLADALHDAAYTLQRSLAGDAAGTTQLLAQPPRLAEDSITSRTLLKNILEVAGYKVEVAADGEQALRKLRETPFDAVVSDIEMPNLDGIALTEGIRADPQLAHLPVVLVTSLVSPADRERGAEAGPGPSFPVPIVVVQHIATGFVQGLADWLTAACTLPAEVATPAIRLRPGRVYLTPDGLHMRVADDATLVFDDSDPVKGHKPAVSCLFESVAQRIGRHAIGILLTGMGRDGAAELKRMKDAGAITIAQDRASSAIHGMPGEAIRAGAATYVMSQQEIATALPAFVTR